MTRKAVIALIPLFLWTAGAQTTNRAQLLTTGHITKIDAKKRILTVRNDAGSGSGSTTQPQAPRFPGGRPGGGIGGRRRGGIGFPGGDPFPGGGGRTPRPTQPQGKEFKVTVTDQTSIQRTDNNETSDMSFSNLNVGDHITIHGLPTKGDDLEATQITLMNR